MCTRFVYHTSDDIITGFDFDIDLSVWHHKIFKDKNRFYIGILRPDGQYHSYHGVNRNGNVGTLLYVHGNKAAQYRNNPNCITIAALTEGFIKAKYSFDDVLQILQTKQVTYAPDATMQAMLSDNQGRVLIIEPGIGYREEKRRFSLITNYSLLDPKSTRDFITPGDDRYERALKQLKQYHSDFTVKNGLKLLDSVHQEGKWATRVSFLYSLKKQTVFYVKNNDFQHVHTFSF